MENDKKIEIIKLFLLFFFLVFTGLSLLYWFCARRWFCNGAVTKVFSIDQCYKPLIPVDQIAGVDLYGYCKAHWTTKTAFSLRKVRNQKCKNIISILGLSSFYRRVFYPTALGGGKDLRIIVSLRRVESYYP